MKRILSLLLSLVMVFSLFSSLPTYANESKLIVHYQRDDGAYAQWNLWVWPEGGEGQAYAFTETDDYGVVAIITLPGNVSRAGFIVRTDQWDKDVSEDRFVELNQGFAEIWVRTGEAQVRTSPPDNFLPYGANGSTGQQDAVTPSITPSDVDDEDLYLRVHYHRFDNRYTGWNLWLWPEGGEGDTHAFTETSDFGMVAHVIIPEGSNSNQVGIIVRLNDWDAKDVDQDRFISVRQKGPDGILDVYLVQSDAVIYYEESDVDLSPKMLSAALDTMGSIRITLSTPYESDLPGATFSVTSSSGNVILVDQVVASTDLSSNTVLLTLNQPLTLGDFYQINSTLYGDISLSMHGAFDLPEFEATYFYDGDDLGVTYTKEKSAFRLWAPTASKAELKLYETGMGDTLLETHSMTLDAQGTFVATLEGDLDGTYYTYVVTVEGQTNETVDPYAKAVGVNGMRGMVIDLSRTNPVGWNPMSKPVFENFTDAFIYELHVRDVSTHESSGIEQVGKFLGLTETGTKNPDGLSTGLDHLVEFGITHLQLIPVFDYRSIDETNLEANVFNWGYDPQNYNAPEGSYATDPYDGAVRIREFKEMVKALHDHDIRVIMDVVYNHTGATADSHLNLLVPGYYYRMVNGQFANGSACGNEVASERAQVRKMIVDSVVYWASEYGIDGFRFDLMGLHDLETMQAVRDALDLIDPSIIVFGEGWTGGPSPLPDSEKALKRNIHLLEGVGAFSDDLRDGIKGDVFNHTNKGFVNGGMDFEESIKFGVVGATEHPQVKYFAVNYSDAPWANAPLQAINYAEAHDNLTLWDKLTITNPEDDRDTLIAMDKMAAAIFMTAQGVPFIHAGMEFLRSKDGDENSYQSPDSVNQINWNLKTENLDVYNYYKGLIELRKAHSGFRMMTQEAIQEHVVFYGLGKEYGALELPSKGLVAYMITGHANEDEAGTLWVAFNANPTEATLPIPKGSWAILADGETAGSETLRTHTGTHVTIPALSTLIMRSDGVYGPENDYGIVTVSEATADVPLETEETADADSKSHTVVILLALIGGVSMVGIGLYLYLKKKKQGH